MVAAWLTDQGVATRRRTNGTWGQVNTWEVAGFEYEFKATMDRAGNATLFRLGTLTSDVRSRTWPREGPLGPEEELVPPTPDSLANYLEVVTDRTGATLVGFADNFREEVHTLFRPSNGSWGRSVKLSDHNISFRLGLSSAGVPEAVWDRGKNAQSASHDIWHGQLSAP